MADTTVETKLPFSVRSAPHPSGYGIAILAVAALLLIRYLLDPLLHRDSPLLAFILAVLIAARYGGPGPALFATALSAFIGNYFFIEPIYSLAIVGTSDFVRLLLFMFIGLSITAQTEASRRAQKRAEESAEAERLSEERFRLMVASVQDYAICTLDPQGCVTTWNEGAQQIKGYTAEEMFGEHISRFYAPEDVARGEPERALAAARAQGRFEEEGWRVRKDGSRFLAHVVITAVRDEAGVLRGFAKVARDITDRRQAQEALQAAYEQERHFSSSLQRSLLLAPPEDNFPGIAVVTHYESAWEELSVGGDFFDVFALEGGKIALVVGDISGKGLAAAVLTAEVKFTLRAYLNEYRHLGRAMTSLNNYLCDVPQAQREGVLSFTVLTLAVIDPASGAVSLAVAGAEPPLVLRASGKIESMDPKGSGLPLGIRAGEEYPVTAFQFSPGDTLLITTDGIIEARHGRKLFGPEGMEQAAREAAELPLRQIGQAIVDAARAFAGGTLQDDVCLLLARLR